MALHRAAVQERAQALLREDLELRLSSSKPQSYHAITRQKSTWSARKTQTGWKWTKYLLQGCPRDDSFSFSYTHPKRDWEEYSNWNTGDQNFH